jgi:hypothetical protein
MQWKVQQGSNIPFCLPLIQLITTLKIYTMENTCNCGKTDLVYRPEENLYEPECLECYYREFDRVCSEQLSEEGDELPF